MIYVAVSFTFIAAFLLLVFKGNEELKSPYKVNLLSLFALLFTTSLDGGLILLPYIDFAIYEDLNASPEYAFSNPLAIEFGFWGFLSWTCYFITTVYFSIFEPKIQFFQRTTIKWINNSLIILTCAFTAWLLFAAAGEYLRPIAGQHSKIILEGIVFVVIALSVFSSSRVCFIKYLSIASVVLLIVSGLLLAYVDELNWHRASFLAHNLGDYFIHLEAFIFPINDYHEFYLFWWLAWSVLIGQFTAQFVQGIRVYQLFLLVLVLPSLPIAVWFAFVYDYFLLGDSIAIINVLIVVMGALFVVNSMDSMIRLYSVNLNLHAERLGLSKYLICHFLLLAGLTKMFDIQMLNIEAVGGFVFILWLLASYGVVRKPLKKILASNFLYRKTT